MKYTERVLSDLQNKYPYQPEFLQAAREVLESIAPAVDQNEALYQKEALLERLVEPDRQIQFKVPWVDDHGVARVNIGYRVQFNNAIGPYKGGLRLHPSVNLSILNSLDLNRFSRIR